MAEQDLKSAAFAALDPAQMAALARCRLTTLKRYQDGQKLFDVGDRDLNFFVVKTGSIEIVDESGDKPRTVVILGPSAFTGEVAQLNGGPSIVSGLARGYTEVYEVSPMP